MKSRKYTWNTVRVKIQGPSLRAVARVQETLAEAFGDRAILSPILRSNPSGFHAYVTVLEGGEK